MTIRSFKTILVSSAAALVAGLALPASAHETSLQTDIVPVEGITLDDGVTPVDVNVSVYTKQNHPCWGPFGTLVTLHGFTFNAASWEPLAEALVTPGAEPAPPFGFPSGICRVVAIDMPGHGDTVPNNADIDLDDYVSVLDQVLKTLPFMGLSGTHVMGHSMGGGLLWMLQDRLKAQGSSILQEYFILKTTLVAPAPPDEVGWGFAGFGRANLFNSFFVNEGFLAAPPPTWPQFYFGGLDDTTDPVRPSDADLTTWLSPEPLGAAKQMFGYVGELNLTPEELEDPSIFGGLPSAAEGIFAPSFFQPCAVNVVGYEGDALISLDELRGTYEHLTGDTTGRCLTEISGPDTIHETHIANPELFVQEVFAPRFLRFPIFRRRGR